MTIRNITCILCPQGCNLEVTVDGDSVVQVKGNGCGKGKSYGAEECLNPRRIVTSSVKVIGGEYPLVSVKTAAPVPKAAIWDCMRAINDVSVRAPVSIGQVIVENVAGTGINVIATRNVAKADDMKEKICI
ncbi:MAG: hypothetical protein PWP48_1927 [Clostridiales bacterium]|jgi:CxxC motif-containing protein|nr:hypothetical protein [Clostridiales bacterium]MDK2902774.1 hypothetical protein [Clostridiales bacterium]MDK2992694.1 hypothetical protein [Clostridiales bacterium]